jgi:hypothetical protein
MSRPSLKYCPRCGKPGHDRETCIDCGRRLQSMNRRMLEFALGIVWLGSIILGPRAKYRTR